MSAIGSGEMVFLCASFVRCSGEHSAAVVDSGFDSVLEGATTDSFDQLAY